MSETGPKEEIEIPGDQAEGLRKMTEWAKIANAELGIAYLQHEAAKERFEKAEAHLRACAKAAQDSNKQRQDLLANVADLNNLPDGEWVYDGDKKLRRSKP